MEEKLEDTLISRYENLTIGISKIAQKNTLILTYRKSDFFHSFLSVFLGDKKKKKIKQKKY